MTRNQELRLKNRVRTQRVRISALEEVLDKVVREGLHGSLMTEIERVLNKDELGGGRHGDRLD